MRPIRLRAMPPVAGDAVDRAGVDPGERRAQLLEQSARGAQASGVLDRVGHADQDLVRQARGRVVGGGADGGPHQMQGRQDGVRTAAGDGDGGSGEDPRLRHGAHRGEGFVVVERETGETTVHVDLAPPRRGDHRGGVVHAGSPPRVGLTGPSPGGERLDEFVPPCRVAPDVDVRGMLAVPKGLVVQDGALHEHARDAARDGDALDQRVDELVKRGRQHRGVEAGHGSGMRASVDHEPGLAQLREDGGVVVVELDGRDRRSPHESPPQRRSLAHQAEGVGG